MQFDLAWHRVDGYAYEHQRRLVASGLADDASVDINQRWLETGPGELARQFVERAELTLPLVFDDLREMNVGVGVVVEGPQLFPHLMVPHLAGPEFGLWLIATEQFQRQVFESRVGDPAKFTSDAARAIELRIERNRMLNERIRAGAEAHGLTVFEVDGGDDLSAMTERVRDFFAGVLWSLPTADGQQRSRLRQRENDANVRNVQAHLAELGRCGPSSMRVPLCCECTQAGCAATTGLTPTEHGQLRTAGSLVLVH
jgi:hypothetical protein